MKIVLKSAILLQPGSLSRVPSTMGVQENIFYSIPELSAFTIPVPVPNPFQFSSIFGSVPLPERLAQFVDFSQMLFSAPRPNEALPGHQVTRFQPIIYFMGRSISRWLLQKRKNFASPWKFAGISDRKNERFSVVIEEGLDVFGLQHSGWAASYVQRWLHVANEILISSRSFDCVLRLQIDRTLVFRGVFSFIDIMFWWL